MACRRVAALYDIHGNLPALDAVLADVGAAGVDRIIVGGDVLPGPMPREALDRLLALDVPVEFIRGNGDREVIAPSGQVPEIYMPSIRWNASQLSPEHVVLIGNWPLTCRIGVEGIGDVVFCHATPRNDTEIFTRRTSDDLLRPIFGGLGAPVVVCGHTHMQFDRTLDRVRIVNAGSIGLPFGATGAFWLLLGPGVELRCTRYDLDAAAEVIKATADPGAAQTAATILQPPSELQILESFSSAELKP